MNAVRKELSFLRDIILSYLLIAHSLPDIPAEKRCSRMVPRSVSSIMKDGKDVVEDFSLSTESFFDSEDEDNDVLNVSCHGNSFKRMFEPEGCGKLAVKRRKLQTHLQALDLEFLALNFEKNELVSEPSGSASTSPREPASERLRKSPRRQKSSRAANNKSTAVE